MGFTFATPILFLVFRQPEITKKVFEQIRAMRPARLYISADGPRNPEEIEECNATRAVVSEVDWPCEVYTRFLPSNLGLKKAVSTALDWFFENEEEGIILEYDCLPDPSFFPFCQEMLRRYRDEPRVFSISGTNLQGGIKRGDGDYYYSRFTGVWGWATWKRSWNLWRPNLEDYEVFLSNNIMESVVTNEIGRKFWIKTFDDIHTGLNVTTWAFCLVYAQLKHGGYSVIPQQNLVKNIGFGAHGTNAVDPNNPLANIPTSSIGNNHTAPKFFIPHLEADNYLSLMAAYSPPNYLHNRIARRIRAVWRKVLSK